MYTRLDMVRESEDGDDTESREIPLPNATIVLRRLFCFFGAEPF
jgi:hypothetical protein